MNTIQNKFDLSEDRKLSFIKKNLSLKRLTLSLNEMETLLKALSSLHLNDPQSPLIKNNTIAMQQYGKVSLRINMKRLK